MGLQTILQTIPKASCALLRLKEPHRDVHRGNILPELPAKRQVRPSLRISVNNGFVLNPPQITWIRAPLCPRVNPNLLPRDCYGLALKRHMKPLVT